MVLHSFTQANRASFQRDIFLDQFPIDFRNMDAVVEITIRGIFIRNHFSCFHIVFQEQEVSVGDAEGMSDDTEDAFANCSTRVLCKIALPSFIFECISSITIWSFLAISFRKHLEQVFCSSFLPLLIAISKKSIGSPQNIHFDSSAFFLFLFCFLISFNF